MSNYIIFSAYYKHGETETNLSNSFQGCFGELVQSIYDFIQNYEDDEIEDMEVYFNKYKVLFETERDASNKEKLYQIFMDKIKCSEEELFKDVIEMNKVLYENDWSIRTIIK